MDSEIFPTRRGGSGWSKSAALAALALAVTGYAGAASNDDPHANHMHPMPPKAAWIKSSVNYKMPEVTLVRADGAKVSLAKELDDGGKPVKEYRQLVAAR